MIPPCHVPSLVCYSEVWKGRERGTGTIVALKKLRPQKDADDVREMLLAVLPPARARSQIHSTSLVVSPLPLSLGGLRSSHTLSVLPHHDSRAEAPPHTLPRESSYTSRGCGVHRCAAQCAPRVHTLLATLHRFPTPPPIAPFLPSIPHPSPLLIYEVNNTCDCVAEEDVRLGCDDKAGSTFLVFEYLPYDLAGLVESGLVCVLLFISFALSVICDARRAPAHHVSLSG